MLASVGEKERMRMRGAEKTESRGDVLGPRQNVHALKILRTVVVLPLNFLSFLPPCVSWYSFFPPSTYFRLFSDAAPPITKRLTILSRVVYFSPCPVIQTKTVTAKCCQSGETFLDFALISRSGIRAFVTIVLFIYLIGLTMFRVYSTPSKSVDTVEMSILLCDFDNDIVGIIGERAPNGFLVIRTLESGPLID